MIQTLLLLYRISRPRFWLYTAGPYVLGILAISSPLSWPTWQSILFFLFFLFPANLLIYGVNDIFDYETDKENPKKQGYEKVMAPESRKRFCLYLFITLLPFALALPFINPLSLIALCGFLFFSIFYSSPPIRAKARPYLDMIFNILYVFPGIFAYWLGGGGTISFSVVLAAMFWCMAMHAFSAIPDIEADRKSHLSTVATRLGAQPTIVLCAILYTSSALFSYSALGLISVVLGGIYGGLMIKSYTSTHSLFQLYRLFPFVNAFSGAIITIFLLLNR